MSNYSSAEIYLNNPTYASTIESQMKDIAKGQAYATLALVEAQQTANLIAFLEWSDEKGHLVSNSERAEVILRVKERIKW